MLGSRNTVRGRSRAEGLGGGRGKISSARVLRAPAYLEQVIFGQPGQLQNATKRHACGTVVFSPLKFALRQKFESGRAATLQCHTRLVYGQ